MMEEASRKRQRLTGPDKSNSIDAAFDITLLESLTTALETLAKFPANLQGKVVADRVVEWIEEATNKLSERCIASYVRAPVLSLLKLRCSPKDNQRNGFLCACEEDNVSAYAAYCFALTIVKALCKSGCGPVLDNFGPHLEIVVSESSQGWHENPVVRAVTLEWIQRVVTHDDGRKWLRMKAPKLLSSVLELLDDKSLFVCMIATKLAAYMIVECHWETDSTCGQRVSAMDQKVILLELLMDGVIHASTHENWGKRDFICNAIGTLLLLNSLFSIFDDDQDPKNLRPKALRTIERLAKTWYHFSWEASNKLFIPWASMKMNLEKLILRVDSVDRVCQGIALAGSLIFSSNPLSCYGATELSDIGMPVGWNESMKRKCMSAMQSSPRIVQKIQILSTLCGLTLGNREALTITDERDIHETTCKLLQEPIVSTLYEKDAKSLLQALRKLLIVLCDGNTGVEIIEHTILILLQIMDTPLKQTYSHVLWTQVIETLYSYWEAMLSHASYKINNVINSVLSCVGRKLHDTRWEVRDSALVFFGNTIELEKKFPGRKALWENMATALSSLSIMDYIWSMREDDSGFIRSKALEIIGVILTSNLIMAKHIIATLCSSENILLSCLSEDDILGGLNFLHVMIDAIISQQDVGTARQCLAVLESPMDDSSETSQAVQQFISKAVNHMDWAIKLRAIDVFKLCVGQTGLKDVASIELGEIYFRALGAHKLFEQLVEDYDRMVRLSAIQLLHTLLEKSTAILNKETIEQCLRGRDIHALLSSAKDERTSTSPPWDDLLISDSADHKLPLSDGWFDDGDDNMPDCY
eukprot:m.190471 g.190471  ORF g.190471 m.190471 type:complete len:814 (+) comp15641_c0_seq7:123-2564(+)